MSLSYLRANSDGGGGGIWFEVEDDGSDTVSRLFLLLIRSTESECGFCPAEAVLLVAVILASGALVVVEVVVVSVVVVIEGFDLLPLSDFELPRAVPASWDDG